MSKLTINHLGKEPTICVPVKDCVLIEYESNDMRAYLSFTDGNTSTIVNDPREATIFGHEEAASIFLKTYMDDFKESPILGDFNIVNAYAVLENHK